MAAGLRIATDLTLPLESVTQTTVILAKKGAGKTNTAVVMVEEASKRGQQVLVVDPTGAWHGIRSSADGEKSGLAFVVFGGENGDVPLEEGAGELVASAFVEHGFSAVIDLSLFRKAQLQRFMASFLETLYRLNRNAMLLVIDEADSVAPQKPFGEEARTLGAMQDVVRRGRIRGIGCVMITQRPQVLNKDVLTQADMLVALRMSHPKDMAAVKEWVDVHADPAVAKEMMISLPGLPTGTAWFWAPDRNLFQRVQVRRRETFDSSATPKPGERKAEPKKLAKVDLQKLGADIAATLQKQKENSPAELKKRIAELESAKGTQANVPDLTDRVIALETENATLRGSMEAAHKVIESKLPDSIASLEYLRDSLLDSMAVLANPKFSVIATLSPLPQAASAESTKPVARVFVGPATSMSKAARAVLTVLAQFGTSTKNKTAAVSGYSVTSGSFRNTLSECRTAGWLNGSDPLTITADGLKALGSYEPLPTGRALLEQWQGRLSKAAREIMLAVVRKPLSREQIGEQTGYSSASGSFRNALSELRTLEIIQRGDPIALHPDFAEAIR